MGMSQTGCCCNPCVGNHDICCLKCTINGGYLDGMWFYAIKRSWITLPGEDDPFAFTPGEPCSDASGRCHNLSGQLVGPYHNTNTRSRNPFYRYTSYDPWMGGSYYLRWSPDPGDDCTVSMQIFLTGWLCSADSSSGYPVDPYLGQRWRHTFKLKRMPSNWYTTTRTLTDSIRPSSGVTMTIQPCPADFEPLPPENRPVRFRVYVRTKSLNDCDEKPWSDWRGCIDLSGDLLQGTQVCGTGANTWPLAGLPGVAVLGWCYQADGNISLKWSDFGISKTCDGDEVLPMPWGVHETSMCVPFDGGNWVDAVVGEMDALRASRNHYQCPICSDAVQYKIEEIDVDSECEECGAVTPPVEDGHCMTYSPCVDLVAPVVVDGDLFGYKTTCHLTWIPLTDTTGEYRGDCAAPTEFLSPDGNLVVVTFWMYLDESRRPTGAVTGSDTYILVVTIKDAVTDAVLDTREYVLSLFCSTNWTFNDAFDLSTLFDVDYTGPTELDVRVAVNCSTTTVTPPPDCDPLCWPDCVLCPTALSMSLVVTQDPSCCLHGSYGLSYDAGNNWFTLTSAPVGGPSGVCGKITAFKMTCSDSTHVTLAITYEDVNGSTYSTTNTVSASCSGGGFETASVTVISGLFAPGLCEGGIGLGAKFRVVGI